MLEYDQSTQSHRLIEREEAEGMFDAETVSELYGELAASRKVKGLLNALNRAGYKDVNIADYLEITKGAVSKWRSGASKPRGEKIEKLEELRDRVSSEASSTLHNSVSLAKLKEDGKGTEKNPKGNIQETSGNICPKQARKHAKTGHSLYK